jgi:hypothetical protein
VPSERPIPLIEERESVRSIGVLREHIVNLRFVEAHEPLLAKAAYNPRGTLTRKGVQIKTLATGSRRDNGKPIPTRR